MQHSKKNWGEKLVVLEVEDGEALTEVCAKAAEFYVPYSTTSSTGKADVSSDEGPPTVVAFGPANEGDVDRVTGQLSVLM